MNPADKLALMGFGPDQIAGATERGRPLDVSEWAAPNGTRAGRVEGNGWILIVVPGPPPGKPQMTQQDKWMKRPAVVRYREWCDLVLSLAGVVPLATDVESLVLRAFFEPPQSWPKRKRCAAIGELHRKKPDTSNILKGLEDCLWPDGDEALAQGMQTKRWDWTARLEIEIVLARVEGNHDGG